MLRVLQQLAQDEGAGFPLANPILAGNIYVDDYAFGADDESLAIQRSRDQLIQLLSTAGFHLRKLASNCPTLISDIDPANHGLASEKLFSEDENLKILEIAWDPDSDSFRFRVHLSPNHLVNARFSP